MSPVLSEVLRSGFMISSSLRRGSHLVQSFSVVFLYWFYLRKENAMIRSSIGATAERCVSVEAENSVLAAQMMELTHRLGSLNEILSCIGSVSAAAAVGGGGGCMFQSEEFQVGDGAPWNSVGLSHHPIMAEMFDY
ncbi:hypothetical protein SASPL_102963 [Salvia splendens]|uniref:Uncharacterized protein n=1 Tax=Salvia splendens TaxID=180675 RepID=A0A8X8YS90_SALSN|nr:hypothetical protein SASPL_155914 [Salvia splendens]KAG6438030.1 hypothetical protein SASPL_102963 [Salvia splendens]